MLTIDVKTLLLCILIFAGIVLVVFLIVAVYNLIKTLKKSQKVLDDFEIVSKIASERSQQLDKLIEQASKKIKASQNVLSSIPIIFKAVSQVAKVIGQQNKNDTDNGKKQKT